MYCIKSQKWIVKKWIGVDIKSDTAQSWSFLELKLNENKFAQLLIIQCTFVLALELDLTQEYNQVNQT